VQDAFSHTVHAELLSDKSIKAGKAGCEGCHGPGSAHVATGGQKNLILQPAKLTAKEENTICLKCHQTLLPKHDWLTSEHAAAKLSCSSCHVVMKQQFPRLLKAEERPLCLQCHAKVRTELSLNSHHPVLEGRLVCGACHDPHSGAQDKMLKEEQDRLCERCHADVQGPFAFEHPVSEGHFADGCLSCHLPHGSPNRALVRLPGRGLCLQCHTDKVSHRATTPSTRQSCTIVGCHNQIHGSNSDPLFLQ
jgi:DmsE family decaheme c-type cytochrome